ncbi:MAG: ATP-binding protein [Bacteroidales bacterium]|nr:ATP-binding protein [Bacteroidales bacterium]
MKYPIGIQTFARLREEGYIYVDKTEYVYHLIKKGSCYFLSRPRRFGKSLLLTTIQAYFQGRKDLFEGLALYELEKEWRTYPVLRFDFNAAAGVSHDQLYNFLKGTINQYADNYDVRIQDDFQDVGDRFGNLISQLHKKTGEKVVVLIDEYDKGLVETFHDERALERNETLLRGFFSQLKAQDEHLRFAMLTGVARFKHLTIFSGLNNLNDISMDPDYAGVCGLTMQEIMSPALYSGVERLANELEMDTTDAIEALKRMYDGYRFSKKRLWMYNPFSVLQALAKRDLSNYWISTGTSRIFIRFLRKGHFQLEDLVEKWVPESVLSARYTEEDPIPLLYQTGYLTIKDCRGSLYRLDIPNGEVRSSLVEELIPTFMKERESKAYLQLEEFKDWVLAGEPERWLPLLRSMLAGVPYQELEYKTVEKSFHLMVYMVFLMLGVDTRAEVSVAGGRIDMVAQTPRFVYVMEFKVDCSAQEALDQIDRREYALPYEAQGRRVFKIGIPFSSKTRTMGEALIQSQE